ncbi:hypothetical protein MR988_04450 [bacterium]|nr:hypothetical protein [bacterium]
MTPQEAIEILEMFLHKQCDLERTKFAYSENTIWIAVNMAKQALEKQIPKKPIKSDRQEIRYTLTYDCPTCGRQFTGTGFADYCYHCGQALDWSDDK